MQLTKSQKRIIDGLLEQELERLLEIKSTKYKNDASWEKSDGYAKIRHDKINEIRGML